MIQNICYELLNKTKPTTDILLRFEDNNINQAQYSFIKDRLDNFDLIIDSEYSIKIDSKYDESIDIISIEIILSISDLLKPKNIELDQIINDHSYRFINFYERTIQSFNSKNKSGR
jgi:hypothetical protein